MRHSKWVGSALAAAMAAFLASPTAEAAAWWNSSISSLGTGGPTGIAHPTGEPILGHNFIAAAPFYTGKTSMGLLVLASGTGTGSDKVLWEYINVNWFDLSPPDFWGLNASYDNSYFYGYTSTADATLPGTIYATASSADSWGAFSWSSEYTSVQFKTGIAPTTARGWATRLDSTGVCSTTPCIVAISGGESIWDPNPSCSGGPHGFNAEQVACDYAAGCTGATDDIIWLTSSGTVQHPGIGSLCGGTEVVAETYSSNICGGSTTLYAVQVAFPGGTPFALGGVAGSYTSGPGDIYEWDATCWTKLGGPSAGTVVSIMSDTSPAYFSGGASPYDIWATDEGSKIWARCTSASPCPAPNF
jgi:hypothetical protein